MDKETAAILDAGQLTPIVKLFYEYGAFAMAVFFLALCAWFFVRKERAPAWAFFCLMAATAGFGMYIKHSPPPQFYVHEMRFELDLDEAAASKLPDLGLFSSEDRVWMNSSRPAIKQEWGVNQYTWRVLALDRSNLSNNPDLRMRAGWSVKAEPKPYPRVDAVPVKIPGGTSSKCALKLNLSALDGEGNQEARVFTTTCVEVQAQNSASLFGIISTARAQTPEGKNLQSMDRDELLKVIEQLQKQRTAGALQTPAGAISLETTVVWYEKPDERVKIADALQTLEVSVVRKESRLALDTNAIWVGADVDEAVAKSVAKALLGAGIQLQYFGPFSDANVKTNLIEIGSSAISRSHAVLMTQDIDQARLGKSR